MTDGGVRRVYPPSRICEMHVQFLEHSGIEMPGGHGTGMMHACCSIAMPGCRCPSLPHTQGDTCWLTPPP